MKSAEVTGVEAIKRKLKRLAAAVPSATDQALEQLGHDVLNAATADAPRETGALAASGYVQPIAPGVVRIGFRAPYAAAVHERLDVSHPNGRAKFLEGAVANGRPAALAELADAAQAAVEAETE
jgi:hypothetical protein